MTNPSTPIAARRRWAICCALLAAFLFVGVGRGEERKPLVFPAGERLEGYAGDDVCLTINHSEDRLSVWNLSTGKRERTIEGDFHRQGMRAEAVCPSLAAFLVEEDRIPVYSLTTGARVAELSPVDEHIHAVAIASDGRSLAYSFSDGVRPQFKLVSLPAGEAVAIIPGAGRHEECKDVFWTSCLEFSPDGKLVVTSAAEIAALTESRTGKALHLLKGHRNHIEKAAFSRDGKRLATLSCDWTIFIWDVATGESLAELRTPGAGGAGVGGHVEFSPDGGRLLWAGWKTTRVWSVADRKLLKELPGFWQGKVGGFRFTPDGKRLIEYGPELLVWDLEKPTDKPLRSLGKGVWFHLDPMCRWIGHRPADDDDAPQKLVPVDFSAPPPGAGRE